MLPSTDSSIRNKDQIARMQYFVVMIDYGRRGREAIVNHEARGRLSGRIGRIQEHQLHP